MYPGHFSTSIGNLKWNIMKNKHLNYEKKKIVQSDGWKMYFHKSVCYNNEAGNILISSV